MSTAILIVDEDATFRRLIADTLTSEGYAVVQASTGADASRLLSGDTFAGLIVNGVLPDQSGIDFIEALRASGDGTRVLFVSEFWRDRSTFRHLTKDLNVARILSKPFTPEELVVQVRSVVGRAVDGGAGPGSALDRATVRMQVVPAKGGDDSAHATVSGERTPVASRATRKTASGSFRMARPPTKEMRSIERKRTAVTPALDASGQGPTHIIKNPYTTAAVESDDKEVSGLISADLLEAVSDDDVRGEPEILLDKPSTSSAAIAVVDDVETLIAVPPPVFDDAQPTPMGPQAMFADLANEFDDEDAFNLDGIPSSPNEDQEDTTIPLDVLDDGSSLDDYAAAPTAITAKGLPPARTEFTTVHDMRKTFADGLHSHLRMLETALDPTGETADLHAAVRAARRLRSAAKSYGYEAVATVAARLEAVVEDLRSGRGERTDGNIDAALDEAKAVLQRSSAALDGSSDGSVATVLVLDADGKFLVDADLYGRTNLLRVLPAKNIEDARRAAKNEWIDCAILGTDEPLRDASFAFAKELRSWDGMKRLPIGFVGSARDSDARFEAIRRGGDLYLSKPVPADDLVDAVRRLASVRQWEVPRVLQLLGDETLGEQFARTLVRSGYDVALCDDPDEVLERLASERPHALVLSTSLSFVSGYEICKLLRSTSDWADLPIIFVTDTDSADERIACFQAGGNDCVSRRVDPREFAARVRAGIQSLRRLAEISDRDPMSGLLTQRSFLSRLRARLAEARRFKRPLSLCLLNIDGLKLVNQQSGYAVGDRIISEVGARFRYGFRTEDALGRWSGDRFAVALLGEAPDSAEQVIARELEAARGIDVGTGVNVEITFSAGIAAYPEDGSTLDRLFKNALRNLDRARDQGGNSIVR